MTNLTKILYPSGKESGLIAVEVPGEAKNIELHDEDNSRYITYCTGISIQNIILLRETNKYEYVGTCSSSEMDFDPRDYVEKISRWNGSWFDYKNYMGGEDFTDSPSSSFRSLLAFNGIYWENPLGERPKFSALEMLSPAVDTDSIILKWQEAESKRIKGEIVIIKTI